jgi:hypothetical protein
MGVLLVFFFLIFLLFHYRDPPMLRSDLLTPPKSSTFAGGVDLATRSAPSTAFLSLSLLPLILSSFGHPAYYP